MIPTTEMPLDEQLETLKKVTIFSGFSDEDLLHVCKNCSVHRASKGERVITEGTEASEILILLKGRVVIILNIDEDPIELMEFGIGSCIGEASVIGIQSHSASAVTIADSILMVLHRQVLMQLFDENKPLFALLILNIARELARRLHHTDTILLHYGKMNRAAKIGQPGFIKDLKDDVH